MDEFLVLTLNIFILVIVGAIIENIIPNEKMAVYIKPAISVAIVLTVIVYCANIKLDSNFNFEMSNYSIDTQSVWEHQTENCEKILEQKMLEDCQSYNINIEKIDVSVEYTKNSFKIKSINIVGTEKTFAKNYISGKYNIGLAYINTDGD